MSQTTGSLKKGIGALEKKITGQIDKVESTLDSSVKNILRELGRLREMHQTLSLKKEVLARGAARKSGSE